MKQVSLGGLDVSCTQNSLVPESRRLAPAFFPA
jgi:hypothetical protein